MNIIVRTLSFLILWFISNSVGLSQQLDDNTRKAEVGPIKADSAGAPGPSRTLDDIRGELKKKSADAGGMPESGMGTGAGGMASGAGMPGSMMGGSGSGYGGSMMGGRVSYGGSVMGSGIYGSMDGSEGYGESSMMGGAPTEKQLLTQSIQLLRGRLGSKKFKRESVEKQLRSALQQYFEADMEERVKEFDKVKARVIEMESKLQRRLDSESEIIELQLKQMLHKADGLDFAVPDGNAGGFGMSGSLGGEAGMMPGSVLGAGSMGSGYGEGGDMGSATIDGDLIGYDSSFGMTRVQRLDPSELDDSDPLKSYGESQTTALTEEPAKTDADKLKTILLAMHKFHERFNHFPKSTNRHAKSQPLHSWRVAILPLIGQSELFKMYRFDQPWDSEENLQVAKKMPELYRSVQGKQNSTQFMMIFGGGAFDSSNVPPRFLDITDGTSNTIALIQSDREVAWTKPEDVTYSATGPLPGLSQSRLIGMADGTTKNLPKVNDNDFRALITRAKGEPNNLPSQP